MGLDQGLPMLDSLQSGLRKGTADLLGPKQLRSPRLSALPDRNGNYKDTLANPHRGGAHSGLNKHNEIASF